MAHWHWELDHTTQIEAQSYYFISNGKPNSYTLRSFLTLLFSGEPLLADVDVLENRTTAATSKPSTGRTDDW